VNVDKEVGHTYMFCMDLFFESRILNVTMLRNFDVASDKFDIDVGCT
jgi:hypothetical protein